jgi:hypothetical protein
VESEPESPSRALLAVRRAILIILVLGITGTLAELILLVHYEDLTQLIPLGLLALALFLLFLQAVFPRPWNLLVFQATMVLFVAAGVLGVFLHYDGSKEFQLEMDPSLTGMNLFWKAAQAKAPPKLAPGLMVQLGLLGLVYAFTHRRRN